MTKVLAVKQLVRTPWVVLLGTITLILFFSLLPIYFVGNCDDCFDDFIEQQIPFILETKRMLSSGTPWWSWNTYFGENFIATYSFYTLTSPFVWIAALFSYDSILAGILFALWLKCLAIGSVGYLYLKRMGFTIENCLVGALMYCFSSYFIVNLRYYHFCEPMIMFPLLLIALENVLDGRKHCYSLLSLASFGVTWINYYFALPSFLCGAIYACVRCLSANKNLPIRMVIKSFASVIVGILLSGVVLVPTILYVAGCPRTTFIVGEVTLSKWFNLVRAFVMPKIAEGAPIAFSSWDFSSKAVYLPVVGPFLAALFMRTKEKHSVWLRNLLFTSLILAFLPPLNNVFSGFTNPYYYRWFYSLSLMLILASVYVLECRRISYRSFWYYVFFVVLYVGLVLSVEAYMQQVYNHQCISYNEREVTEILLTGLNLLLLGVYVYSKQNKRILLALVCFSAVASFATSVYVNLLAGESRGVGKARIKMYVLNNPLAYNEDNFRYRIDYASRYPNIPLLKNRPGVYSFHSIFDKNQNDYRSLVDPDTACQGLIIKQGRISHDILLSVKEYYDYRESVFPEVQQSLSMDALTPVDSSDICTRYKFNYYVPMGFCYDTYIKRSDFDKHYPVFQDPVKPLLMNLVIEDSDEDFVRRFMRKGIPKNVDSISYESIVSKLRLHVATAFEGDTHGFTAITNLDSCRMMFFSVAPDPGFSATIDGKPTKIYKANLGFSAVIVPVGKHIIRFEYLPEGLKIGLLCTIIAGIILLMIFYIEHSKQ